jgi:hypothetical protein
LILLLGSTPRVRAQMPGSSPERLVAARVELAGLPERYPLPVHACLQDGAGVDYLLVFGAENRLRDAGWPWRVLARNIAPEECLLASEVRPGARAAAGNQWHPLYDDGRRWLLRADAAAGEAPGARVAGQRRWGGSRWRRSVLSCSGSARSR